LFDLACVFLTKNTPFRKWDREMSRPLGCGWVANLPSLSLQPQYSPLPIQLRI